MDEQAETKWDTAKDDAMREEIKILSEAEALRPTMLSWIIILGDNILYPAKDIPDITFQFLGASEQVIPFDIHTARVTTTTGGVGQIERDFLDGGWAFHCSHMPREPGFRTYLVSMFFDGPRPKVLRVRLREAQGDDCDVRLTEFRGELVTGIATGTEWNRWSIPE